MNGAIELGRCPGCGNKNLISVSAGEQTNFFCDDCVLCWYLEHGRTYGVDPRACPGCRLGKTTCLEGVGGFHSRW
jgi:hypothetical protein